MKRLLKAAKAPQTPDDSIIEVQTDDFDLSIPDVPKEEAAAAVVVPHWEHTYVYSASELEAATPAQQEFYAYFKDQFLKGEAIDLEDNTNYAFVLYFELLQAYRDRRNIWLLEKQFDFLAEICPQTRSYTSRSLHKEKSRLGVVAASKNTATKMDADSKYYHTVYDPHFYKLGTQYKDQLGLNKQQVRWLNKFDQPNNVFLDIEGCLLATIKQYLDALQQLEEHFKAQDSSLAQEIEYFKAEIKVINQYNSNWWYSDHELGRRMELNIYLTLFRRAENTVRAAFGHKRKLSSHLPYREKELQVAFEIKIGHVFQELLEVASSSMAQPDLQTEMALNAQNASRWKAEFKALKQDFQPTKKEKFVEGIRDLAMANQKNPKIGQIFFEAAKYIAKHDPLQALAYYAQYSYHDSTSKKFALKPLTKTVQKSLFKTEAQHQDFKAIIADLIKTRNLEAALEQLSNLYAPKRKRIQLDRSEIQAVEQKYKGTVALLNEYLQEEQEKAEMDSNNPTIEAPESKNPPSEEQSSIFVPTIKMTPIQEALVQMMVGNDFQLPQTEVEAYALQHELFKNQLIDSINEACEAALEGEALIEEEDDQYTIEPSYYEEIIK